MKATATTTIAHPPQQVFDFVADMRNDPRWAPMVAEVEQVAGDGPAAGARYRYIQQMGRHRVPMECRITRYERPRLLRWRIDHKAMDYEATMRFEPHPRGTRVVQTNVEAWHYAPWHLRIMGPFLVRKQLRRQLALLERAMSREEKEEV